MLMILWIASALAQDAPAPPGAPETPAAPEPQTAEPQTAEPKTAEPKADVEIVVWGQLAIDVARDKIIRELERLGYRVVRRQDGKTVLKAKAGWMGRATLEQDGAVTFSRPLVGFGPSVAPTFDPRYQEVDLTNAQVDRGGASFWLFPSSRRLSSVHNLVVEATRDESVAYLDVVRRTALEEEMRLLPERLDAVWNAGTPLAAGERLTTFADKRAHILGHWATRTETIEGIRACETIEGWLEAVVEASDHPIREAERAQTEAKRSDGRKLPRTAER